MNFTDDDIKRIKDASASHLIDVDKTSRIFVNLGLVTYVTALYAKLRRSLAYTRSKIFMDAFLAIKSTELVHLTI